MQPFYDAALHPVQTLEELLGDAGGIDDQVAAWQENPFKPHVIARMRVVAYMKAVVMSYIDNLIAWGDQLFRQDTIETINEATQLYVLAAQILGKRPAGHSGPRPGPRPRRSARWTTGRRSTRSPNALVGHRELPAAVRGASPVNGTAAAAPS